MTRGEPLLIEIGCEEIPARMIRQASLELADRVVGILDRSALGHGKATDWGGPRRLAVHVDAVAATQVDREETVTGPPARIGWSDDRPTPAALGFARKQGVAPEQLVLLETERGSYVGFRRQVEGRSVGEILCDQLPRAIEGMPFAKTMRWADGRDRWVRPVHWLLVLHGGALAPVELFGVKAAGHSMGHRFRSDGPVPVEHPGFYIAALEAACVVVDPLERRRRIERGLRAAADRLEGELVADERLLDEVCNLVEWPGVVEGRFDPGFLDLPEELLVTTLRHHQKCFSVRGSDGRLRPGFLAVANSDDDPAGHVRRGNEWVVEGRLDDARFFWGEDRKRRLEQRHAALADVMFHARLGSYAEKAGKTSALAADLGGRLGMDAASVAHCREAARLAKVDLVSSTVGEFPELQGRIGGLLLAADGGAREVADAIYAHYQPVGPDDAIPGSPVGRVVAVADKLDSVGRLATAGEVPKGSKDPLGLRRAQSGIFRILIESRWPLSLDDLWQLGGESRELKEALLAGFQNFLRERGWSINEIHAAMIPRISETAALGWPLHEIVSRLEALERVRGREDFRNLVKLTQRVHNILTKEGDRISSIVAGVDPDRAYRESVESATALAGLVQRLAPEMEERSTRKAYREIVENIAAFIEPVERFFDDVLVVDDANPEATFHRKELLLRLRSLLTRYFDIRELAGQARRSG